MNRKIIIGLMIVGAAVLAGIVISYSLYNKPHRQITNEPPAIEMEATALYNAYVADEARADSLYLDKVLQIHGVVEEMINNEVGEQVLVLESPELFGINCTMSNSEKEKLAAVKVGSPVTVKGICNGMLMDVVLVKCILVDAN